MRWVGGGILCLLCGGIDGEMIQIEKTSNRALCITETLKINLNKQEASHPIFYSPDGSGSGGGVGGDTVCDKKIEFI